MLQHGHRSEDHSVYEYNAIMKVGHGLELQTNHREVLSCMIMDPSAFSWGNYYRFWN